MNIKLHKIEKFSPIFSDIQYLYTHVSLKRPTSSASFSKLRPSTSVNRRLSDCMDTEGLWD